MRPYGQSQEKRIERLQSQLEVLRGMSGHEIDGVSLMRLSGMEPDPWQSQVLNTEHKRILMLCSRQVGKSTTSAALAVDNALSVAGSEVLITAPSHRQSKELLRKVRELYVSTDTPVGMDNSSADRVILSNGSRISALPGDGDKIRGFSSVDLLIMDEAAWISDEFYYAVRPMLAVSGGTIVALSSAWSTLGWFYDAWHGEGDWQRVSVTADDCPRITAEFLEEERKVLGESGFKREYFNVFSDPVESVFSYESIKQAFDPSIELLFPHGYGSIPQAHTDAVESIKKSLTL